MKPTKIFLKTKFSSGKILVCINCRLKTSKSCPNVREPAKPSHTKPISKPQSSLKLKSTNVNKEKKFIQKEPTIEDSVELSFMGKLNINFFVLATYATVLFVGKLEKADKKDTEELRAFEFLEEAALDSSFCSTSSTVKKLMENVTMPSPIPKRFDSHTSTPKPKSNQGTTGTI